MSKIETWRDIIINNEATVLEVSVEGLVRNKRTKELSSTYVINSGYQTVNAGGKRSLVHRLVATAFLGESPGKEVDHKNRNKLDNRLVNLEWVTKSENAIHAFSGEHAAKKTVFQYDMGGQFLKGFDRLAEAARECKIDQAGISRCIHGKQASAGGFQWSEVRKTSMGTLQKSTQKKQLAKADSKTGQTLETYESISEAARINGVGPASINHVCTKYRGRKSAAGYGWKFV